MNPGLCVMGFSEHADMARKHFSSELSLPIPSVWSANDGSLQLQLVYQSFDGVNKPRAAGSCCRAKFQLSV